MKIAKTKNSSKNQSEFKQAHLACLSKIHSTRGKLNELAKKKAKNFRAVDIIRLRTDIQEDLASLKVSLKRLEKIVKANQKSKKIISKEKLYRKQLMQNLWEIYKEMRSGEDAGVDESRLKNGRSRKDEKGKKIFLKEKTEFFRFMEKP